MPEGPEVETVRRGLLSARGVQVVAVSTAPTRIFRRQTPDTVSSALLGSKFIRFDRYGKHLLCGLSTDEVLAVHLRMTGRFFLSDPESSQNQSHVHLRADLDDGRTLLYIDPRNFGEVFVFNAENRSSVFPEFATLGPDLITEPVSARQLTELFHGRKRRLKAALLDQHWLAGLGNIYADESAFRAGLHPETPVGSLTSEDIELLAAAINTVLAEAVARGGSTLADGSYRRPDGTPGNAQSRHKVYARAGRPCFSCGTSIEKIRVAQRGTSFCPSCQPVTK